MSEEKTAFEVAQKAYNSEAEERGEIGCLEDGIRAALAAIGVDADKAATQVQRLRGRAEKAESEASALLRIAGGERDEAISRSSDWRAKYEGLLAVAKVPKEVLEWACDDYGIEPIDKHIDRTEAIERWIATVHEATKFGKVEP